MCWQKKNDWPTPFSPLFMTNKQFEVLICFFNPTQNLPFPIIYLLKMQQYLTKYNLSESDAAAEDIDITAITCHTIMSITLVG